MLLTHGSTRLRREGNGGLDMMGEVVEGSNEEVLMEGVKGMGKVGQVRL